MEEWTNVEFQTCNRLTLLFFGLAQHLTNDLTNGLKVEYIVAMGTEHMCWLHVDTVYTFAVITDQYDV